MKYVLDRIEGEIAILENLTTKELLEVNIKQLPPNLYDGIVLEEQQDGRFLNDREEQLRRKEIIATKLAYLKNLKK